MSQILLDLTGIAANQDGLPEPIATALSAIQTGHNDTDTNLSNITSGHNHDGSNSRVLSQVGIPTPTLGYAEATTAQTGITTEVDVTSCSIAVTVPSGGRRVKITAHIYGITSDTDDGTITLAIKEGATRLNAITLRVDVGAGSSVTGMECVAVLAAAVATAGSHTYKLTLAATTGTLATQAAATHPSFILVELI